MSYSLRMTNDKFKLSPWENQEIMLGQYFQSIQVANKKKISQIKKSILVHELKRTKNNNLNQIKNTIPVIDYSLPPINSKNEEALVSSHQNIGKKAIRNLIQNKGDNTPSRKYNTIVSPRQYEPSQQKFKLSGKRCLQMQINPRLTRWNNQSYQPRMTHQAIIPYKLVFGHKRQQVLKKVLNQLQFKIK